VCYQKERVDNYYHAKFHVCVLSKPFKIRIFNSLQFIDMCFSDILCDLVTLTLQCIDLTWHEIKGLVIYLLCAKLDNARVDNC